MLYLCALRKGTIMQTSVRHCWFGLRGPILLHLLPVFLSVKTFFVHDISKHPKFGFFSDGLWIILYYIKSYINIIYSIYIYIIICDVIKFVRDTTTFCSGPLGKKQFSLGKIRRQFQPKARGGDCHLHALLYEGPVLFAQKFPFHFWTIWTEQFRTRVPYVNCYLKKNSVHGATKQITDS